jgi:hypothetical protein
LSDERFRELERKWKESGSVDDEAKYLRERVRTGDLSSSSLRLAATLLHEAARQANAEAAEALADSSLAQFGPRVALRIGVAAVRGLAEFLVHDAELELLQTAEHGEIDLSVLVSQVVDSAESLLISGLVSREVWWEAVRKADAARTELCELEEAAGDVVVRGRLSRLEELASALEKLASLSLQLQDCIDGAELPEPARISLTGIYLSATTGISEAQHGVRLDPQTGAVVPVASRTSGGSRIYYRIQQELVPWALGHGDPVWSRVQEREGKVKIRPKDLET